MTKNFTNTIFGLLGWTMTNAPTMQVFESLNGVILVTSSSLGIVMLFISIRTGIVNYRIRELELKEKKKALEKEKNK